MNFLKTKEFLIGVITAVSLSLLIFGINYLKGVNLLKPANYYVVEYDNVKGLELSSPVQVEGFKVGLVTNIALDFNDPKRVLVTVSLDKKLRIPKGSIVSLEPAMLGGAALIIKMNNFVSEYHNVGDSLKGEYNAGMMGTVEQQILPAFEKMLPRLDSILLGINSLINSPAMQSSLNSIERTTSTLESATASLDRMMKRDMPAILANVNTLSSDLVTLSSSIKGLDITSTYNKLDGAIGNINELTQSLNSQDGTIGLLLNDTTLYSNLSNTAGSANELLIDLRKSPKRYVHFSLFGRK
ncbi:MAG: MlaD family protein [Bacteroidales bacterium]